MTLASARRVGLRLMSFIRTPHVVSVLIGLLVRSLLPVNHPKHLPPIRDASCCFVVRISPTLNIAKTPRRRDAKNFKPAVLHNGFH